MIGNPPHRGTVNKLRKVGIPLVPHRAKQITLKDYDEFDYIIGMDTANMRNLNRMLKGDPEGKVYKFLTFAGSGRDIADPWYTGNFDVTYDDVVEGCEGFSGVLREKREIIAGEVGSLTGPPLFYLNLWFTSLFLNREL